MENRKEHTVSAAGVEAALSVAPIASAGILDTRAGASSVRVGPPCQRPGTQIDGHRLPSLFQPLSRIYLSKVRTAAPLHFSLRGRLIFHRDDFHRGRLELHPR